MSMPAFSFDTLKDAKRLEQAGLNRDQAEAQAEAFAEVVAEMAKESLADKEDVFAIKQDIAELTYVTSSLKGEVTEIKQDVATLKEDVSEIKTELAELKHTVNNLEQRMMVGDQQLGQGMASEFVVVRQEMRILQSTMTIRLGGMIVASMGILATLMTIFHYH